MGVGSMNKDDKIQQGIETEITKEWKTSMNKEHTTKLPIQSGTENKMANERRNGKSHPGSHILWYFEGVQLVQLIYRKGHLLWFLSSILLLPESLENMSDSCFNHSSSHFCASS